MVKIGIGKKNSLKTASPGAVLRGTQRRERFDLDTNVRRCIEEKPGLPVRAHDRGRLRSGAGPKRPGPKPGTIGAGAVPLGESSPGCSSQDADAHDRLRMRLPLRANPNLPPSSGIGGRQSRRFSALDAPSPPEARSGKA